MPLLALEQIGLELVAGYPRVSQDFNAIENCWHLLRERLKETLPIGLEPRSAFIKRLKEAVQWVNRAKRDSLIYLSRNQKERCRDCENLAGGRTQWWDNVCKNICFCTWSACGSWVDIASSFWWDTRVCASIKFQVQCISVWCSAGPQELYMVCSASPWACLGTGGTLHTTSTLRFVWLLRRMVVRLFMF